MSNLTPGRIVEEPLLVSAQSAGSARLFANATYYSSDLGQQFEQRAGHRPVSGAGGAVQRDRRELGLTPGATDLPVTFTIRNTGTVAAQEVQLNLQSTYPLTPISSTYYVSNLAPGATTNVTFLASVDSQGVPSTYPVTIYEQWKQPNGAVNQQFSGSNNYYIVVNQAGGGYVVAAIVVVVVAGVAYMVFRRMKAKGKGKEKPASKGK